MTIIRSFIFLLHLLTGVRNMWARKDEATFMEGVKMELVFANG